MMSKPSNEPDGRIERSRSSVIRAFVGLALDRRYDNIRIDDLIADAGIGRSTFYEHFRGKDDVLLTAMEPILLPLASAASGRAGQAMLHSMLAHLWDRRAFARIILDSRARPKLCRRLAAMIEARLAIEGHGPEPLALPAMAASAGQLSILRMWLAGEVSCSVSLMADQLMAFVNLAVEQPDT